MNQLTDEQVGFFKREGYLVAQNIIPEPYLANLRIELEAVIEVTAQELHAEGKLTHLHPQLDFLHRATELFKESPEILSNVTSGSHAGQAIFDLITCAELLDAVEQLVGPEIISSSVYRTRPKLPFREEGVVPWHQDQAYFDPISDDKLVLTVWIPLMNATIETGCMEVLPRSHKRGVLRHYWADTPAPPLSVHPDYMPVTKPAPVPANLGDVVLLTNCTVHRSTDNSSGLIRWSVDLRYNDVSAGDYYPYEAGFLARSRSNHGEVVTDWREFARLRKDHQPQVAINRQWLRWEEETFAGKV